MSSKIDEILKSRQQQPEQVEAPVEEADKFFSALLGEGLQEHFLELQFRNGLQTCFSYNDLLWFNHDPEAGCIDLEIGGFMISIKGRGLKRLFASIKSKRVAWVREADSEMQDHSENECFVEEISITPPQGFAEEEPVE